jgi:hypothetical protein
MKIEIETKYAIGDQVAVMEAGLKVNEGKVTEIIVYVTDNDTSVRYFVEFEGCRTNSYGEEYVFPSRQAIIDIIQNGGKEA